MELLTIDVGRTNKYIHIVQYFPTFLVSKLMIPLLTKNAGIYYLSRYMYFFTYQNCRKYIQQLNVQYFSTFLVRKSNKYLKISDTLLSTYQNCSKYILVQYFPTFLVSKIWRRPPIPLYSKTSGIIIRVQWNWRLRRQFQ